MASGNSYNVLGVVTGVLGVFGLVPASYMLAKSQLPMAKAKDLEILLSETTELLRSVAEEGLLSSPEFIDGTRRTLARIQSRSNELRLSAYSATSTVQQAKGLFCGLSYALHRLGNEVKQVRAMISNRCNHVEHRRRGVFEASLPLTPITESSSGADEHAVYDRADNRAVDDDRSLSD
ncbi:hypothetical protein EVJ58_g4326 [Rhodofomes roseus]|uniref:Uncharacterized protein n=1 Tax=Rhodofomes roseus TaxID=34475 RepID=A0A4Y9YIT4_9APHY|nr:hypothetical protein EVJ58_g4326 [Rhodofomes roseus]